MKTMTHHVGAFLLAMLLIATTSMAARNPTAQVLRQARKEGMSKDELILLKKEMMDNMKLSKETNVSVKAIMNAKAKGVTVDQLKKTVHAKNLAKRKKKGILKKKETSLANVLFPGTSPNTFNSGDYLAMQVDVVDSKKTQLPYEYYKLPVCKPATMQRMGKRKNLGERLMGRAQSTVSPFETDLMIDMSCKVICTVPFSPKQRNRMMKLIKAQYAVNLSLDSLPVYVRRGQEPVMRGYPLGSKLINEATGEVQFFYHNHLRFTIEWSTVDTDRKGVRIVGFRVTPVSINHDQGDNSKSCGKEKVINQSETLLRLELPSKKDRSRNPRVLNSVTPVTYSYEVEYLEVDTPWADRWDVYLLGRADDSLAHHMSIINSFMVVLFLGTVLAVILIKALRKDLAFYNDMSSVEEDVEESGWKMVHGDVFRPPSTKPMFLSVLVGSGTQIAVALLVVLCFSMTNLLNPMMKGKMLTDIVILFCFSGVVAGYVSARIFKFMGGKNWKLNTMYTATLFPGTCMTLFVFLNVFLSIAGSAKSVGFFTIVGTFLIWTCLSSPLVFVGSFLGFKRDVLTTPTRTNQIARVVPPQNLFGTFTSSFFIGGMPFSTICIEVYFLFGAIWMHQYYYLMGYLLGGTILLGMTCALLSTVLCYIRLCGENHRWWWMSFMDGACVGAWLFVYSLWYLVSCLHLDGFMPVVVYLTYMTMVSLALGLYCGSVGFLTSLWFTRTIYSAVKID
jgi:transmembrane 9 superfamily protein 2/4